MARTVKEYLYLLQSLLPWGKIWTREADSNLALLLEGLGVEFCRIESRMDDLLNERDTRLTDELLEEQEREYEIPEYCSDLAKTEAERRTVLHTKFLATGRQDKKYYGEIGNNLGISFILFEHNAARCGSAVCSDYCGAASVQFYWTPGIYHNPSVLNYAYAGDVEAGDYLMELPNLKIMVCLFNLYRPAHTINLWGFWGGGFSAGFDCGFNKIPWLEGPACELVCGGFDKGFNLGFRVNYRIDISQSFTGGFSTGFSAGFDTIANATGFTLFEA